MKPFMKTYGKCSRKVTAWISPDVRKKAFDSTSSDSDAFDVRPAKDPRPKKATRKAAHTARAKVKYHVMVDSMDEENLPPPSHPQPAKQTRTRVKMTKAGGVRAVPVAKKKAVLCVTSTDEESIICASPPQPAQATRRVSVTKVVVRQKGQPVPKSSESEDSTSTAECQKSSVHMKADSSLHLRSVGQFVTRRRRGVAAKPKLQKAVLSILNSSDDFAPGVFGSGAIPQCSRRKKRKRAVLQPFLVSSAENSLNAANLANPFREISLNELTNHSRGPSPRKPMFCSTPSAAPFNPRPRIKPASTSEQSSSLASMSVSCIGALHVDLDSPEQPASPPRSSPPITVDSGENLQSSLGDQEPSDDLFMEAKSTNNNSSRIQDASSHSGAIVTKDEGELLSVNLLSTSDTDSENQSCFVSGAGSSEWLIEALKKKCLTEPCTVQLERLDHLTVTQPCSQRSFSSCSRSHISASDVCERSETTEEAEALSSMLREECLTLKAHVEIKRLSLPQLRDNSLQLKDSERGSPTEASGSASDEPTNNHNHTQSDAKVASDKEDVCKKSDDVPHKRQKTSLCPKEKNRKRTSVGRPGTSRKACVSGLSVSRWKSKDAFTSRAAGGNKTVDCSINELISAARQPKVLMGTTTPVRASRLNLSSLLADLTPNTHTWSQLKATLSIHRKTTVAFTPRRSRLLMSHDELADVSQDLFATPSRTLLPRRLMSHVANGSTLLEDSSLSDAEKVYAECQQQRPLPWEQCILPQRMKQCVKIGEGSFGEVFSTTNGAGEKVALKIIPLEGSEKVNGEDQKTFGEILHEIIISKELSSLKEKASNQTHGFIGLNDLHCVQGCYPPDFLNAWDAFDKQKGSENDRPDFFKKDQLFIILEFEFGGVDLENSNGTLVFWGVAMSILHQVTAALAVAEQELHFEHRDLHWGNVLVKATEQKKVSFLLNGAVHTVETRGVLVRIIDYSLSRLEIDDLTVSCDISEDEELFMGRGDYQFEIYRLMRQENGNCWSGYHPRTNVLWLHYLSAKLLAMKYLRMGGRGTKELREMVTRFHDNVLQHSSATEVLREMFQ